MLGRARATKAVLALETRNLACYVGTYHKTGTVWMERVFRAFARRTGTRLIKAGPPLEADDEVSWPELNDHRRVIALDMHSTRAPAVQRKSRFRGMRVVRDPRDQLISSTRYHLRGSEAWLHEPEDRFDGRTYHEVLHALPTWREQLLFDMHGSSKRNIDRMVRFDDSPSNVRTITYEALMTGGLDEFSRLFEFFGLRRFARRVALQCAAANSLFSNPALAADPHISSGAVAQWPGVFDRGLAESFLELHPTALERLGYEATNDWMASLPVRRPELDAQFVGAHNDGGS
jgi:hypothetical protein